MVKQAAKSARLQELIIETLIKKLRNQARGVIARGWQAGSRITAREMGSHSKGVLASPPTNPTPTTGSKLMEQRPLASLCYKCGEEYFIGHKCKRQLLLLEGEDDDIEKGEELSKIEWEDQGEISLHALKGVKNNKVIKVEARENNYPIMVLIDSESTHSSLDKAMARRLGCEATPSHPLSVIVANGHKVMSQSSCKGFYWEMNRENFSTDLRLLKLGGCNVVLEVDWIKGISPISFEFNKMEVTFEKDGSKKTLAGSQEVGVCKMILRKRLQ